MPLSERWCQVYPRGPVVERDGIREVTRLTLPPGVHASPVRTCHNHIALFHGTSAASAGRILEEGFRPLDLGSITAATAARYGLDPAALLPAEAFVTRRREEVVHLSTSLLHAASYARVAGEAERMILDSVFDALHPDCGDGGWDRLAEQRAWVDEQRGAVPSAVVIVWAPVDALAEGRKLLEEQAFYTERGVEQPWRELTLDPDVLNRWSRNLKIIDFCSCSPTPGVRACSRFRTCPACREAKAHQSVPGEVVVDDDWFACLGNWTRVDGSVDAGEAALTCPLPSG